MCISPGSAAKPLLSSLVTLLSIFCSGTTAAGTIVEVQTSLGDFYIEVNEQAAPITGSNFLNYVRSGRYNNTFIHGATGGTLIRGGGYSLDSCTSGPQPIATDDPIPLESTGLSNLHGTIAALRPSAEPDAATSQWFINLGNDPVLDTLDGGYAVFGKVLGDGLNVVQKISVANPVSLGFFLETPSINYFETILDCQFFSRDNLVQVLMSVVTEDSGNNIATATYNPTSATVDINLDLGSTGFTRISFDVTLSALLPTIQADLDSAFDLQGPVPNMATYDEISGELVIPSIAVDGEIEFRNVIFDLTDPETATFTLRSFD